MKYNAIVVRDNNGLCSQSIEELSTDSLPTGDVLIRVEYSSLNYKDALSATGNKGVTRAYPHTPGIDAAGIVESSTTPMFSAGDAVLVTGYDLGMNTSGGFGEYIRVPKEWVVPIPKGLSTRESMIIGTAGFTAALSLHQLMQAGLEQNQGSILVTGATGGVGSFAVALLTKAGFGAIAATRKEQHYEFLTSLGAKEIISSNSLQYSQSRPLLKGKWAGAIDTVGGEILSSVLSSLKLFGSVAVCGLTLSPEIVTTVYPFILRGNNLLGINSAETPMHIRQLLWARLASDWKPKLPDSYVTECSREEIMDKFDTILNGEMTGRVLLRHSAW